jgi:acetolactate synthase-1/3 small subunit
MKHLITALVENRPGALARIVGLISGRGYNIETLHVCPTSDPTVSKMTMLVPGDDHVLAQVTHQLDKLIDVIEVTDTSSQPQA